MRQGLICSLLMLASSANAGALAKITGDFPDLPAPPSGSVQWVAKSMRLNGLPMTLKSFQSRMTSHAVLRHYESWAKNRGNEHSMLSRSNEWQVLALKLQDHFVTIQAKDSARGSMGTIAVSKQLNKVSLRIKTQFPTPSSASVVNLQQFEDQGVEAEHISLLSPRASHIEARAFAQLLEQQGWLVLREQPMQQTANGRVIEAQKGAELAQLTIFPDRQSRAATAVIIVWKKS